MTIRLLSWLIAILLSAISAEAAPEQTENSPSSVLVSTEMPRKGALDQPVTAYGTVQAASSGARAVASLHAAQVVALHVVQGQIVKQGEPLVDLNADPAATLAYAQAETDLRLARAELARTQRMVTQRLATASQLDQAKKATSDGEAALEARRREGSGKPVETLTAPVAGVVTSVTVANGDHIQPGATLIALAGADALVALLGVAPDDRARVKSGQLAKLADLDAPSIAITAKVVSVGGMADSKTGLVAVVVTPEIGATLLPGAHVRAIIVTEPLPGWIVPRDAVLTDDNGPYVFQIAAGKAVRVSVAILGTSGDSFAISGSLDPARKLVTAGNYQLSDGMMVREQTSATAPPQEKSK